MAKSEPASRRGKSEEVSTRDKIVRHSVELFARNGYAGTSLDDIAKAVGIRKPSLYHYIKTKEDLLYEIQELLAQEIIDNVNSLLATADTPPEKLRAFFRAVLRLVADRQLELTVFINEAGAIKTTSKRWREINEKREIYQSLFEDVLQEGMDSGAFRKLPVTLTALGTLGAVTWSYRWYQKDGLSPDEIADLYSDIILNGIT